MNDYILNYFNNYKGTFLDLGARDGVEMSKTHALVELGWIGLCFEHKTEMFAKLKNRCLSIPGVFVYDFAVGRADNDYKNRVNRKEATFEMILKASPYPIFDFISIDCGEMNYAILSQINLDDVKCNMICISSNDNSTEHYIEYCENFGMSVVCENQQNILLARQ